MERTSYDLLKIALKRRYLKAEVVEQVVREARLRQVSPERVLLERRILSVRRIERLRNHLRFKLTRRNDKRYLLLAIRRGALNEAQARQALRYQKRLFQSRRVCVRVGSYLIEASLLDVDQDRALLAITSGRRPPAAFPDMDPSSDATGPLHEESEMASVGGSRQSNYQAIEAALERVEAIRALQDDMSTSDRVATPDSAADFEDACRTLARRRVGHRLPKRSSSSGEHRGKPKKKTTGAFIAALLFKDKEKGAA